MSTLVLSLLPSQRESLQDLQARYARLLSCVTHGVAYDGLPIHKSDPNTQLVMRALAAAIARRRSENRNKAPQDRKTFNYRPQNRKTGKTDKDKKKEGYIPSDERKKQKAEQSREIRQKMRSTKGK